MKDFVTKLTNAGWDHKFQGAINNSYDDEQAYDDFKAQLYTKDRVTKLEKSVARKVIESHSQFNSKPSPQYEKN